MSNTREKAKLILIKELSLSPSISLLLSPSLSPLSASIFFLFQQSSFFFFLKQSPMSEPLSPASLPQSNLFSKICASLIYSLETYF